MKAPDKIYILPTEMVRYYFTEERIQPAISYIRKDALLEWAKEYKKAIEVNGDEDDAYTRGEYSAINSLIDKLNSL